MHVFRIEAEPEYGLLLRKMSTGAVLASTDMGHSGDAALVTMMESAHLRDR